MYELLHDLISRRQAPEQLEPLEVVLDGETPELHSLSNRRTWALLSFQASCRHEVVKVHCKLCCPTDPAVAQRYAARDTTIKLGWGLGLLLHGKNGTQEAWHLGEPLFRRATEWCENEAIHNQHNSVVEHEQVRPVNAVPETCIQENSTTQVCCKWLVGRCRWNQSHWVNQYYHLHEDVPGMPCCFGQACRYKHYESRMAVTEGMLVLAGVSWNKCFAEVIEVEEKRSDPVKVRYIHSSKNDEWLDLGSLKVPVYSGLEEGMQVTVDFHGERILCTVQQVKKDTRKAPVHVVGTGRQREKEDWVGADRLQSTALTYVAPALCVSRKDNQPLDSACVPNEASLNQEADEHHESTECGQQATLYNAATFVESAAADTEMEAGSGEPTEGWGAKTAVCCMWLQNRCWKRHSHWLGKHFYLHEDVPGMQCGFGHACHYRHYESRMAVTEGMLVLAGVSWNKCFAEVIEVEEKRSDPVKVRYIHSSKNDEWLDLGSLKVPVYSGLEEGMQVTVDFHGERILCTVQQVKKDTRKAPVHVVGTGRQREKEDWVGADRLQSTALTYVAPALCVSRKDNQPLDSACVPNEASLNQEADEHHESTECGQQATLYNAATFVESAAADTEMEAGSGEPTEGWGAKTAVCCMWLQNRCWKRHSHWLGKHFYLHEDVPGMQCGFGHACHYRHYESRMAVTEGMLVLAGVSWNKCFAEVIEVEEKRSDPVKVRYIHSSKNDEWLDLGSLKVPVYSGLEEGMQVTVDFHGERILCTVQQVKKDTRKAPVHVVGTGRQREKEDWVGADRLQSTALTYVAPALCVSRKDNQPLDSLPVQKPTDACVPNEATINHTADELPHEEGLSRECRVNETDCKQSTSALYLQEVPRLVVEDTDGHVLPWTAEESSDDECHDGADHLLFAEHAVELLRLGNEPSSNAAGKLQEASKSDLVRQILEEHSWTGGNFAQAPNTNVLLAQLKDARSKLDDCISISSQGSEPGALEDLNGFDGYSVCTEKKDESDWENQLQNQSDDLRQLTGTLIYGTFRCVSSGSDKGSGNCGEVLIERGPRRGNKGGGFFQKTWRANLLPAVLKQSVLVVYLHEIYSNTCTYENMLSTL